MSTKHLLSGILIALGLSAIVWAYSSTPPDDRAGNPPNTMTCKAPGCHNTFDLNSGDGSLSIEDVPFAYVPGETYSVTITLSDPGQRRWGFELTALDADNQQAGTFVITDPTNTQLSDNGGTSPDFVKQTRTGSFAGISDGPISWTFEWTAPSPAVGNVTFYAAGNAANNNGSTSGDYIYTAAAIASFCVKGDSNGDGNINVLDMLAVANHILSLVPLTGDQICRADCNADGTINILDALGIANVILGIGTCP
jgi:hypothetical protein